MPKGLDPIAPLRRGFFYVKLKKEVQRNVT